MKRADADSHAAQQTFDACAHFARRFVGERKSQNLIWLNATLQQSHYTMCDNAGFPGPGPGQHQQRPFKMLDGLMLRLRKTGTDGW